MFIFLVCLAGIVRVIVRLVEAVVVKPSKSSLIFCAGADDLRQQTHVITPPIKIPHPTDITANINGEIGKVPIKSIVMLLLDNAPAPTDCVLT